MGALEGRESCVILYLPEFDSQRIGNGGFRVGIFWRPAAAKKGQLLLERLRMRQRSDLRGLSDRRCEEVGAARFFRNDKVTVEEMLATASACAAEACADRHILLIEDTSEINYQAKSGRKKNLGKVGNGTDIGLFVHPALALDADDGSVLGLAWADVWRRTKTKNARYRSQPIEDKESFRWIATALKARERLKASTRITVIADREADIYQLFARLPDERTDVIVRAKANRALADLDDCMFETVAGTREAGRVSFDMLGRVERKARQVTLAIRYANVAIRRPAAGAGKQDPRSLRLNVVLAREVDPPKEAEPIEWCLLTTHGVACLDEAARIIDLYRQRWAIEQLFRVAKSQGIDIEESLLEDGEALEKFALAVLIAATMILQLLHGRDESGQRHSASRVFPARELPILALIVEKLEGKTAKQKNPHPKNTLAWASWAIARLGGWKGYKSERPPGPITFLNGLQRFDGIVQGFDLAQRIQS